MENETSQEENEDRWFDADKEEEVVGISDIGGFLNCLAVGMFLFCSIIAILGDEPLWLIGIPAGGLVLVSGLYLIQLKQGELRKIAVNRCLVVARMYDVTLTDQEILTLVYKSRGKRVYWAFVEILEKHGVEISDWAFAGSGGESTSAYRNLVWFLWEKAKEQEKEAEAALDSGGNQLSDQAPATS